MNTQDPEVQAFVTIILIEDYIECSRFGTAACYNSPDGVHQIFAALREYGAKDGYELDVYEHLYEGDNYLGDEQAIPMQCFNTLPELVKALSACPWYDGNLDLWEPSS